MSTAVFVDTSVLVNLLDVPHMNGDHERLLEEFEVLVDEGADLVIPTAAVVEVGNHLAQVGDRERRRSLAGTFTRWLSDPDLPFVVGLGGWDREFLDALLDGEDQDQVRDPLLRPRPSLVDCVADQVGSGDASILLEFARFRGRVDVASARPMRLWTLDRALRTYAERP